MPSQNHQNCTHYSSIISKHTRQDITKHQIKSHRSKPTIPREILHNCTEERPGKPSQPVNFELIRNYLIVQKELKTENHDRRHQVKPLPELQPRQQVLFLNCTDNKSEYIKGTILSQASTPRHYKTEANGRIYHCTRQHICTNNADTPFTRPSAIQHQKSKQQPRDSHKTHHCNSITRLSIHQKSVCNHLTRPLLAKTITSLQDHHQQTF